MLAISHGVCHVSFPTHLPRSAFQHSAHLMYMKHGRSMYMFPTGQTELSSTCSGRTCAANPCCKWIPLSRRYCFNSIKFDPPFHEPFQRCAGAVNGSGAVLLRETAFKTLNCCAWTCHFHSSAFLNTPERSFLLSNETATANRLLLSDKSIINSPTVAREMSDLGVAEKLEFKKLRRALRPGRARACFLCSHCYLDFKSIAF